MSAFRDKIKAEQWRKDHHRGGYDIRKVQKNINHSKQTKDKDKNKGIER